MIKPLRSQSEKIKYRPNTAISGGSGYPNPKDQSEKCNTNFANQEIDLSRDTIKCLILMLKFRHFWCIYTVSKAFIKA